MENKEKLWSMLNPEKRLSPQAVNYLMGLCQEFPVFKVPFLILNRVQADLFNSHLWTKAEKIADNNRALLQLFFRKQEIAGPLEIIPETKKLSSEEMKSIQVKIIENYLNNPISFSEPSLKNI